MQSSLLLRIFPSQPGRSNRAYQNEFYTHQGRVHLEDQGQPRFLRALLDPDNYHFFVGIDRQPLPVLLQLVKIRVHLQTRTSPLRSHPSLLNRPRSTPHTLLCPQIHEMQHPKTPRCIPLPTQLICLYGYSFGCFILVFLLCIIPFSWLHWLLMIYGMANSIIFLIFNIREYL